MSVTDVGVVFSFYATAYCVLTPFFGWILKKTVSKHHNYLLTGAPNEDIVQNHLT